MISWFEQGSYERDVRDGVVADSPKRLLGGSAVNTAPVSLARMAANHGNSSCTLVCHPPDFIDSLMRVGGAEFDAARTAVRIDIEIDLTSVPAEQRPIK